MIETNYNLPLELRELFSAEQAFHFRLIPTKKEKGVLYCLTDQEDTAQKQRERTILLDHKIELLPISSKEFSEYYHRNYHKAETKSNTSLNASDDLLQKILTTAKNSNSSDIHIEVYKNKGRVRLRLDGKLKEFFTVPKEDYSMMINKIKVQARLDIAEKRLPQDGRISIENSGNSLDIRVAVMPTLYGEKVVLRLLGQNITKTNLSDLGLTPNDLKHYRKATAVSQGILLISGPTGSGKTTTLYATLKELNTSKENILTIEDPIEYTLEGINQVQVNEAIGLTFPHALRSFLRQDPDVIMVGEIRDEKTAQIAIRAALTGHLVLATIHTNSAWGIVSRLLDMGIPHFLIAETLKISIAQRLVRCLCGDCKKKINSPHPLLRSLDQYYVAVGCEKCHFTGYKGRMALYEVIPITPKIGSLIREKKEMIGKKNRNKNKIKQLSDRALEAVQKGLTAPEEVVSLLKLDPQ